MGAESFRSSTSNHPTMVEADIPMPVDFVELQTDENAITRRRLREALRLMTTIIEAVGDNGELCIQRAIGTDDVPESLLAEMRNLIAEGNPRPPLKPDPKRFTLSEYGHGDWCIYDEKFQHRVVLIGPEGLVRRIYFSAMVAVDSMPTFFGGGDAKKPKTDDELTERLHSQ